MAELNAKMKERAKWAIGIIVALGAGGYLTVSTIPGPATVVRLKHVEARVEKIDNLLQAVQTDVAFIRGQMEEARR